MLFCDLDNPWLLLLIGIIAVLILGQINFLVKLNVHQKKSLCETEERCQYLVYTSDIIAIITTDGRLNYLSASIKRILGYEVKDWLNKKIFNLIHPEQQQIAKSFLAESVAFPATDIVKEFQLKDINGNWRDFEIIINNQVQDPNITGIVATLHDITEYKKAEAILKESEQIFRQLAENIQAVFWMRDLATQQVIYVSPEYERIWGRSCDSLYNSSLSWSDVIHPQDRQRILAAFAEQVKGNHDEEYRIIQPDGSIVWIRDRAFPIANQQGEIYRITGIAEDITKRKQQEERLRLLESVVVNANDLVVITEAETINFPGPRILYVNEAFTRMTGYKPEEVLGKTPRILQGAKTNRAELHKIRTALKKWQPVVVELINYRKDGSEFWVELSIAPVADETGWFTHWVAVERDITDRKLVEVEIRKALEKEKELSELKSRFIAMASHEFRTPLATILASSDLLKQFGNKLSEEKKLERINKIQAEVKNMTKLLDDVLFFGKAEAGKIDFNPTDINLKEFCQEILEEIEITNKESHNIQFNLFGYRETDCLDEKLLRQILTNLLSNAVKYSPNKTNIYLDLIWQDSQIIFQVKDEGIGIPFADQEFLFQPFHRAKNVGNISGTGLGLTIINNAVQAHKGSINVESKVDVGTTFTVSIPVKYEE